MRDGVRLGRSSVIRSVGILALLCCGRGEAAEGPAHLPRYDLDLTVDTVRHTAELRERVTWTNTTRTPANHLAFNFYPNYRVPRGAYLQLAKTLEMLRLQPSLGIERGHRAGCIREATLLEIGGKPVRQSLSYEFDAVNPTAVRLPLPQAVGPGESVTVELVCEFRLPNKQGRLGYWEGVTYLTNAFPVLAFRDDTGWRPMPFVPWHQPWFNEAGNYRATITLPEAETLACPAPTKSETRLGGGWKRIECEPFVGRDFAVLCSARYREFTSRTKLPDGKTVDLRCLAFPEHEWYAREILQIVGDAIPVYSQWFGAFPYSSFTIVESYFGWNGNECAGLIMIDERVFGMPHLARGYVEYLVSHETCHQWWYNLVGTNGYSEPFVDEGAAAYFTHRMLDRKTGKNNPMLAWPAGLQWMPNITRDNYRFSGTYHAIRNGEMQPAAQELPKYGHLFNLFAGAYDRGSMAYGMIEAQLGEVEFLGFIRGIVKKYGWRVLQIADLRRELEEYTGRDWGEFFDRWIYGKGLPDWKVEEVKVDGVRGSRLDLMNSLSRSSIRLVSLMAFSSANHSVTVTVRQVGDFNEPTELRITTGGGSGETVRVPVGLPQPFRSPEQRATVVPLGDGAWRVEVSMNERPDQVTVDPDRVLLDRNPSDNNWKTSGHGKLTPLYTMLDDTDIASDYDRWNFVAGPWVWGASYQDPWYTRSTMIGLRAGAKKPQKFKAGTYLAYRTDYRDVVLGADAVWLGNHLEAGVNWEVRIGGPFGNQSGSGGPQRAVGYLRHVLKPGASLYLPPLMYHEGFVTYQDNFLPFPRTSGGQRWDSLAMAGYHYRLNLYTPYWDPEGGVWFDAMAGGGGVEFSGWEGMGQGRIEVAGVHHLPGFLGPLKNVRVAARFVGMAAWPDDGQFFALGGGTLFRGFDLAQRQGSALWVANTELRIPIARNVAWDCLDHTIGARNVWLAAFYDAGNIFANGQSVGGVAHALGAGLRVDVAVFSFIERATLRFDVAKTINAATPWQFWFGMQQAF